MGNGGSPPAHLPSSSLSEPEVWLQIKWLQPPPRAPSSPLPWEEWQQEDECNHQQLLNKEAAHAWRQEAARLQQLLDKQAARAHQEAAAARARQEASKFAASLALLQANMAALRRAAEALALNEERHCHKAVLAAEANN